MNLLIAVVKPEWNTGSNWQSKVVCTIDRIEEHTISRKKQTPDTTYK